MHITYINYTNITNINYIYFLKVFLKSIFNKRNLNCMNNLYNKQICN